MAYASEQLSRIGQSVRPDGSIGSLFFHATDAAIATVMAAGYFNLSRAKVKAGDMVILSVGFGGTPVSGLARFATVPASGNITTAGGTITTT